MIIIYSNMMINQNTILIIIHNNYEKHNSVDNLIHQNVYLILFITNNSIHNRHNNHTQTCSNYLHFHYASLSIARGGDVMRVFTGHILICTCTCDYIIYLCIPI